MLTFTRVGALLGFCGVVLIVVGLIVGTPHVVIEGAYSNSSQGSRVSSGVGLATKPSLFDPADGNLWIGAGLAVLVIAAIGFLIARQRVTRPLPE